MPKPVLLNEEGQIILNHGPTQLLPYEDRPFIEREFMSDAEIMENAHTDLILDTENYPNFFMCGFKHNLTNKFIYLDHTFKPAFMSWLMFNYRTIGFNSDDYDLTMLWAFFFNQDPRFLKQVSNDLIMFEMRPKDVMKKYGFKRYDTPHVDLIEVCPLKGSLKLYGARLHSQRLQDLPIPDTKELTDNEKHIVRNYCFNDLDVTQLIFNFNKDRLDLRATMGSEYKQDLMSKSDAQIAEAVLKKEVQKLSGKWPKRPEIEPGTTYKYEVPPYINFRTPQLQKLLQNIRKADFVVGRDGRIIVPDELNNTGKGHYEVKLGNNIYKIGIGGLHSSEESISFRASATHMIIDRDVASYYPRIIVNGRLYPNSMGPDFLTAYTQITDRRLYAKKNKIFATDKGLKIVINGTSGKFSDFWSTMYSPDLTIQTTVTGQLGLLLQIEMQELNGISCISANTDGAVYYCPVEKYELFNQTIKQWEMRTNFETEETLYSGYYARDVNAYFAVKLAFYIEGLDKKFGCLEDLNKYAKEKNLTNYKTYSKNDSVKVKGPYSEVGSQSGTQLDNNPINLICSDAIKQFLIDGTPVEKTIRECRDITRFVTVRNVKGGAHKDRRYLGKVIRWIYCRGVSGTINYVQSGNKVALTDGAWPLMDLPAHFPDNLDYDRYIQIAKEILYDIAYYHEPKQIKFF